MDSVEKKILELEQQLSELKEMHAAQWYSYGSELCAGDMIEKEEKIKKAITEIKNKYAQIK